MRNKGRSFSAFVDISHCQSPPLFVADEYTLRYPAQKNNCEQLNDAGRPGSQFMSAAMAIVAIPFYKDPETDTSTDSSYGPQQETQ